MTISKTVCWVIPKGYHLAQIKSAKLIEYRGKEDAALRIVVEIISTKNPIKEYRAKKIYDQDHTSELVEDLDHLIGDKISMIINTNGEIMPERLSILEGMLVDIEIKQTQGKNFDVPYCELTLIRRAGSLLERFEEAA